jgi:hypothetical protein
MSEYLEVWDHISNKKKNGWRIAELGRNVEEHFKSGNKLVRWAKIRTKGVSIAFHLEQHPD